MRKDWLNIVSKLARQLHVSRPAYSLCHILPIGTKPIENPEAYMATLRKDAHCTCIASHAIPADPAYDLQIIVAVYNAAPYLEACIESVLHQKTHYRYCLTLVDDGSTDCSGDILRKYADLPNVMVYTKPNGGPGSARNLALEHIMGEFITFLDADDLLPEMAVERWMTAAKQTGADIVEGRVVRFDEKGELASPVPTAQVGEHLCLAGKAASRIYRNTCWEHVCFPEKYWAEDTVNWMLVYHRPGLRMAIISDTIYLYRDAANSQSTGSLTHPRRIDSYYGTRAMLCAARDLSLPFTTYYLECFLRQTALNLHRMAILGDSTLNRSLFDASRDLMQTYFAGVTTDKEKERHLQMTLLSGDYKEFLLYGLFLM